MAQTDGIRRQRSTEPFGADGSLLQGGDLWAPDAQRRHAGEYWILFWLVKDGLDLVEEFQTRRRVWNATRVSKRKLLLRNLWWVLNTEAEDRGGHPHFTFMQCCDTTGFDAQRLQAYVWNLIGLTLEGLWELTKREGPDFTWLTAYDPEAEAASLRIKAAALSASLPSS